MVFTNWGSVAIAVAITLYFFRQNIIGIHESSGKALKIMIATTVMAVVILVWCGITLIVRGGPVNRVPAMPDFNKKIVYDTVTNDDRYTGDKDVEMWKLNPKWDPKAAWDGDPETGQFLPQYQVRKDDAGKPITDASGKPLLKLDATANRFRKKRRTPSPTQEDPLGADRPLVPILGCQAAATGELDEHDRRDRPAAGLRPLDSRHERRRDAGPGLP